MLDVVVVNAGSNDISVLMNHGGGNYLTKIDYPVEKLPASVAIGDLNGDGKPDLAVANAGSNSVTVLWSTDTSR